MRQGLMGCWPGVGKRRPGQRERSKLQRGFTLIEVLVAVGILGALGPALMMAIGTASRFNQIADQQVQAEALARSQLDSILNMPYNADALCYPNNCYPVVVALPPQYNMAVTAAPLDTPTCSTDGNCNTLQLVTASVSRPTGDSGTRPVLSVSVYKGKR